MEFLLEEYVSVCMIGFGSGVASPSAEVACIIGVVDDGVVCVLVLSMLCGFGGNVC